MSADRSQLQAALCEIFRAVLQREQIGPDDSFFDCGGDSMAATQTLFEIAERFSVTVSLQELVQNPTPAALAIALLGANETGVPMAIGKRRHVGWAPTTADQERNWLSDTRNPAKPSGNFSVVLELTGSLDLTALEQAINDLMRRHEPLRSSVRERGPAVIQVIHPYRYRRLKVVAPDIQSATPAGHAPGPVPQEEIVRDLSRPFYLSRGPLVRWTLYRLAPDCHRLAIAIHQIVSDGVSMGLLLAELSTQYRLRTNGVAAPAEPLAIQLGDYAEWESEWLAGSAKLTAHLEYWRSTLTPPFPPMTLPCARARGTKFVGGRLSFTFDASLAESIRAFCTRKHTTHYALFMSVLCLQLHASTQDPDIVVATQVGRRSRAELRPIIGKLAGLHYVRTRIDQGDTAADVLSRVAQACVGLVANEDMPCSRALSMLNPGVSGLVPSRVMLVMLELTPERVDWSPLSMKVLPGIDHSPSEFDLSLFIFESAAGIHGRLECNATVYSNTDMAAFLEQFMSTLRRCIE